MKAARIVKAVYKKLRGAKSTDLHVAYYGFSKIARHWRGWTRPENAEAYESLLVAKVLPALNNIAGYCGGYVLRNDGTTETEFVVINFFESLEAVKQFAGPDYEVAVFEPEAQRLLSRIGARPVIIR